MSPDQKDEANQLTVELIELLLNRTSDNNLTIPSLMAALSWFIAKDMLISGHSKANYLGMVATYLHENIDSYKDRLEPHRDTHPTIQ